MNKKTNQAELTRKPSAKRAGVKAVKAWAMVTKQGTFKLNDVCSTRERAYYEVGAWNHHETCPGIQDARKRVIPVLITPLGGRKEGK